MSIVNLEMSEGLTRLLFGLLWFSFAGMRIYYQVKAGKGQRRLYSRREGRGMMVLRLFAMPYMLLLFLYPLWPSLLGWASMPLPDALRWVGFGLMTAGVLLCWRVNYALGRYFSGTLVLRPDHRLIQDGPYRRVRHPMYTAFVIMMTGMLLLSANWFIGGPPLAGVLFVMVRRTPKEEAMLLDRFGDEYRDYMRRTGRYLPRLGAGGA